MICIALTIKYSIFQNKYKDKLLTRIKAYFLPIKKQYFNNNEKPSIRRQKVEYNGLKWS